MTDDVRRRVQRAAMRRMPLMAIGLLSMAYGAWLGLVRLGWNLPVPRADTLAVHGPLMVCGFLGTLVSVERAVALGRTWGYIAPVSVAGGAVALGFPIGPVGPVCITVGSVGLIAIFAVLWRRQPTLFIATMALGAVAWAIGNVLWLDGFATFRVVGWWLAFLVLTIAGERLELNRVLRPRPIVRAVFLGAVVLIGAGVLVWGGWPDRGIRIFGAGLLVLAAWLLRYDVVRRTIRQRGLTRYMAITLLVGYAWLAIGGVLSLVGGAATPGVLYDATLHAVFLGFVMSMVFAHAPVIFPAVLGRPLVYAPRFYAHVGSLQASLVLRIVGDLVAALGRWRAWGGLLNAVALGVFVVNVARSVLYRGGTNVRAHASGDAAQAPAPPTAGRSVPRVRSGERSGAAQARGEVGDRRERENAAQVRGLSGGAYGLAR